VGPHTTILVVEDQAGVRDFLADGLRLYGYQAIAVCTVLEAEATRQRLGPGGIDLVIANINLTPDSAAPEGYALAHPGAQPPHHPQQRGSQSAGPAGDPSWGGAVPCQTPGPGCPTPGRAGGLRPVGAQARSCQRGGSRHARARQISAASTSNARTISEEE
jgi:hypothetical protein